MNSVHVTVVVDNVSHREDAPAEHGLCLHVESGGKVLLFDTGKSELVLSNLKALGLFEPAPEWIVLSHGHYDHTNGTPTLLKYYPHARLCFHPTALEPKWIFDPGDQWRYGGVPFAFHGIKAQPRRCSTDLIPGVCSSGSVAGDFASTFTKSRFFRNKSGELVADAFPDEQVLFVKTEKGLSILSGCMHTGIRQTIKKAMEIFPNEKLHAIVGGFHLDGKSEDDFLDFMELVIGAGIQKIMPLHCSGRAFGDFIRTREPELFVYGGVGYSLEL